MSDLMRIERQLERIVQGLPGIDTLRTLTVVQCAMYHVRGQGNDPHAKIADSNLLRSA